MAKMVLNDVIAERYVALVPYDVPKNIRYVANQMTPIGQRSRVSLPTLTLAEKLLDRLGKQGFFLFVFLFLHNLISHPINQKEPLIISITYKILKRSAI